jgi:uncharacterized protein (TIRG00374 family)
VLLGLRERNPVATESLGKNLVNAVSVSAGLAAAAYLGVVLWAGRTDVMAALRLVSAGTILSLLFLSLINYLLRFLRWHYYLHRLGNSILFTHDLRIYICGFAFTTTPGKAGELARTLWLSPYGVSANSSVAAFFAERIQDFIAILLLSCLGLSTLRQGRWLLLIGLALVLTVLIVLFVPAVSQGLLRLADLGGKRVAAFAHRLTNVLEQTRGCLTPSRLLLGQLIGIAAWLAEAFGFAILMHALGQPFSILTAVSIYALSLLAGAVSFMPGGLGGSEAAMIVLLRVYGVAGSIAVSGTLLIRLATLWFAVLLGMIALVIRMKPPARSRDEVEIPTLGDAGKRV